MPKLRTLHHQILNIFKSAGVGSPLSLDELKRRLGIEPNEQKELPKRLREMKALGWPIPYNVKTKTYSLFSAEQQEIRVVDDRGIPGTMRARVLYIAHDRCGMCGRTGEDGIKLAIDHRIPYSWGGETKDENLWALCYECNTQKKDFFATLDPEIMKKCMRYSETQRRLGELLKAYNGEIVPRSLLEVVGRDDEWTRRLRDLRSLGWDVEQVNDPTQSGRYVHAYRLLKSQPWPASISIALKEAAAAKKAAKARKPRQKPAKAQD